MATALALATFAVPACADDNSAGADAVLAEVILLDRTGAPAAAQSVIVVMLDRLPDAAGTPPTPSDDVATGRTDARGRFLVSDVDRKVTDTAHSRLPAPALFQVTGAGTLPTVWVCPFARTAHATGTGWTGTRPVLRLRPDGSCDNTATPTTSPSATATTAAPRAG